MIPIRRRALGALPLLALPGLARAQAFPARQVRLVVGFAPGGANDIMARLLAANYQESFPGGNFVVENRPGAGTLLAAEHIARAAPDGYSLLYASTSTLITSLVNSKAGIEVPRDFAAIAMAQSSPLLLVARADFPARTLADVIALAKQKQGRLTVSHPGTGGINHLSLAVLMRQAGIELTLVPYNGNQPSITALLRGDVDMASDSLFATRAPLEAGQIRAIAITSAERLPTHRDVPTFAETLPGYEVMFWGGLLAPRGTPEPVLEAMNRATDAALKKPDVAERVRGFGAIPVGGTREFYARAIAEDWRRWGEVVRENRITAD
jgi:tripartite-type tricarboxylate transporter receptor subunit TctC